MSIPKVCRYHNAWLEPKWNLTRSTSDDRFLLGGLSGGKDSKNEGRLLMDKRKEDTTVIHKMNHEGDDDDDDEDEDYDDDDYYEEESLYESNVYVERRSSVKYHTKKKWKKGMNSSKDFDYLIEKEESTSQYIHTEER